jgi:ABC-type polysaccharide/polyol phosphate transport system ATPase subunit
LDLQIVNLSKKYEWHRAPRDAEDDDPELAEDEEAPAREIETEAEAEGERWALRGINAVIKPGEKVGIIGSNGAGKSTLLNILAGITLPSGGYVRGRGLRVLLNSLRTPFRGQLTGRQNLHILAALLGVEAGRLEARMPEILEFSGMENFIDRRVQHYSTQQYRRLTFATALMLDPEIILSDDTLGIGDARYQQRTEQLIAKKVENEGVIFILASNRLSTIRDLCSRVIWLENGKVAADGPAEEVIEAFMDADKGEDDKQITEVEPAIEAAEREGAVPSPAAIEARESVPAEPSPVAIKAPEPARQVLSPVAIEAAEPAPAALFNASVVSGAPGTLPSEAPLADEQSAMRSRVTTASLFRRPTSRSERKTRLRRRPGCLCPNGRSLRRRRSNGAAGSNGSGSRSGSRPTANG